MARRPTPAAGSTFVAVLAKRGKVFEAESVFGDEEKVFVGRRSLAGAHGGDLVLLKSSGRGRGEVVRRLGKSSSPLVIMEAILTHFRVPRGFPRAAIDEADAAAAELATSSDSGRRDLTGLFSLTIDPDEARDFDDAISLMDGPGEGEVTLYVHIADVGYYVRAGSALDAAAATKSCSVYLPLAVEPMLPPVLSNDVCSLRPGVDRKCLTVEMAFRRPAGEAGEGGEARSSRSSVNAVPLLPQKASFYRSTIRSRRRLTYNQVDDLFEGPAVGSPAVDGRAVAGLAGEVEELLRRCRVFAAALRAARHARGALNIHTFEPEFRLNQDGEPVGVRPRPQSESHALIEEFMIAANEAVARFLSRRNGGCVYRVHEEPDPKAVDALFDLLDDLGVATPPFSLEKGSPQAAAEAIRKLLKSLPRVLSGQQRNRSIFGEIVLRSLKQAIYLEENLGHFGLASPAYLHFTSPIRRYPDLVVHRALLRELGIEDYACDRLQLAEIARQSSENERRAALVERTGDDVVLAFLLDRLLFEEGWDRVFEGEIVGVIPSGVFVRFEGCYEGYVPARRLWGDYFRMSDKGSALVGRRRGRAWRLGDRISVRVARIDKLRGKVELEPAR